MSNLRELIDAKRLDHYHRLEREHIHLTLLEEAIRGFDDLKRFWQEA